MSDDGQLSNPASATDDWPAKATQTLVGYVDTVRAASTGKALVASRALVYFLAVGLIAVVLFVLALIGLVRLLTSLSEMTTVTDPGEVWLAYLFLGVVFWAIGLLLWRKKDK